MAIQSATPLLSTHFIPVMLDVMKTDFVVIKVNGKEYLNEERHFVSGKKDRVAFRAACNGQ